MPFFEVKETENFDGIYQIDAYILHPHFDDFNVGFYFNCKGEYLVQFADEYLGLFKNKDLAVCKLVEHLLQLIQLPEKPIDLSLECTKPKCQRKTRKKENDDLKLKRMSFEKSQEKCLE